MGRWKVRLALVGMALLLSSAPAYACSGDPCDVNRAEVIAEGWVERATPLWPGWLSGSFQPIEVVIRVERAIKGEAPNPLRFVERGSYRSDTGRWVLEARAASWTSTRPATTPCSSSSAVAASSPRTE